MKNHNIDVFLMFFLVRLPVATKVSPLAGLNGLILLLGYQGIAPSGAQILKGVRIHLYLAPFEH